MCNYPFHDVDCAGPAETDSFAFAFEDDDDDDSCTADVLLMVKLVKSNVSRMLEIRDDGKLNVFARYHKNSCHFDTFSLLEICVYFFVGAATWTKTCARSAVRR